MSTTDAAPTPPAPAPADRPIARQRRRWKRAFIVLAAFVILGFVVRVLLPLMLPMVLKRVAGAYGLTCQYDRLELNLLSGDAGIWGVEFKPKDGGEAVLQADYAHGNISVLNLLRGRLHALRVEADGINLNIQREADGRIPLLERFIERTAASAGASAPVSPAARSDRTIDLTSPVKVDAFRLSHVRMHIHDSSLTPALDTVLAMNLRLSNLGLPTQPAKFEMDAECDPMLDSLQITAEGQSGGKSLDAKLDVLARGIRLKPLAAYLQPLGIRPVAEGITLHAEGRVRTAPTASGDGFAGSIAFDRVSATADLDQALALERMTLDASAIDNKSIRLSRLTLDGVRAVAERGRDGHFRVAGIEWDPSLIAQPATTAPAIAAAPAVPAAAAGPVLPAPLRSLLAEPWSLGDIVITNIKTTYSDRSIAPVVELALVSDQLTVHNIDHDPQNPNTETTLSGTLHAPGVVRDIKLSGTLKPFAPDKSFALTVDATGVRPDALKAYLDKIGIESQFQDGTFSCAVDGAASIDAAGILHARTKVENISLRDGSTDLLAFKGIDIAGAALDPATGKIRVEAIDVSGPTTSLRCEQDGSVAALGLQTKKRSAAVVAADLPVTPASQPAAASAMSISLPTSLPLIEIGHFAWKDAKIELVDNTGAHTVKTNLSDLGVEMTNCRTAAGDGTPGKIHAWLSAPNIADHLNLEGTVTPASNGISLDVNVVGQHITAAALAPYVAGLGVEPVLQDGGLTAHARADIAQAADGLKASLSADQVRYTDGDHELAAVDALNVKNVSLRAGELDVDGIEVDHARASAARDADGTFLAGGVRLRLPLAAPAAAPVQTAASTRPLQMPALPFAVVLSKLHVVSSGVEWTDRAVEPTVNTVASVSVDLDHVVLGRASTEPATLNLTAKASGAADEIKVTGTLLASPDKQAATLDIAASGVRAGPLAAYLPPGLAVSLKDGRFRTKIDAAVSSNSGGGKSANLSVTDLDFRDGAEGDALLSLDSVKLIAPQIDLPSTAIAVEEFSVVGLETRAQKSSNGSIQLLGIELGAPVSATTQPAASTTAPVAVASTEPAPVAPVVSASDRLAAARRPLPLVTLDKLSIGVRKLTITDESKAQIAAPIVVSNFELKNIDRIDWLGKDAAGKPPTHFRLTCKVDPLVDQIAVDALLAPFAQQPSLAMDVAATGVRGDGLTTLLPILKPKIDGSQLTDGRLSAHFETAVKLERRTPIDFDISRGCNIDVLLKNVEYRGAPDGPVLAGLDELHSDGIRFEPAGPLVSAKTLEITKPIGFITQDEAGIHALGWTIMLPGSTATTQPIAATEPSPFGPASNDPATVAVAPIEQATPVPTPAPAPTTTPAAESKPWAGEVRIDQLLISGLDARFEDHSCDPPVILPLNGLDVEVRDFSTRSLHQAGKPIRFSAIVNAGKVRLPKHGQLAVKTEEQQFEDRDLFAQITANGNISFYPVPTGWAKVTVSGFELYSLAGLAKKQNVTLRNGTFDDTIDIRLKPENVIDANARLIFSDLSVSEPPDGFIAKTLHFTAPLDQTIRILEAADGSITLPVPVTLRQGQLNTGDIVGAATGAIASVIAVAVLSAPEKVASAVGEGVGGLLGIPKDQKPDDNGPFPIDFAPGAVSLTQSQLAVMRPILARMKEDSNLTLTVRHELGGGDVQRASERANPSPEDCRNLEYQLRTRKAELLRTRADITGQARGQLVSLGEAGAASTLAQLRAIDMELGKTEAALDQVLELLRPGADRQAARRTRQAALAISRERIAAVKASLLASSVKDMADRLQIVEAQFNPTEGDGGGRVLISLVEKK